MGMEAEERISGISSDAAWDCALGLLLGMPVCLGILAGGVWLQRHGAGSALSPVCRILLGLLPLHIGLVGSAVLVLGFRCGGGGWRQRLYLGLVGGRAAVRVALRSLAWVYPTCLMLSLVAIGVLRLLGKEPAGQPVLELLLAERHRLLLGLAVLVIVVAVPFAEELLFRLFLHDALTLVDVRAAAPLTAFTFAVVHGVPEQIPALFLLGLVLQDLRARTGSLWAGMGLHAGFNACSLLLLVAARTAGLLP